MDKRVLKKIEKGCGKFFRKSAERPLVVFVALFLLVLLIGAYVFYQYNIRVKTAELPEINQPVQFKENVYQEILAEWQNREGRFDQANGEKYINPFQVEREAISEATED